MKIMKLAVFSMLIIMLTAAAFVPLTMQMTEEIKTAENNDGAKFNLLSSDDDEEVVFENVGNVAYIDGKQLLGILNTNTPAYVISDAFIMRSMYSNGNMYSWDLVEFSNGTATLITKLTVSGNEYSWTSNDSSGSGTIDYLWYPDRNGDYIGVLPNASMPAFVNNDATIYTVETGSSGNSLWKISEGTINNMTVLYASDDSTTTPTFTKETIQDNLTRVNGVTYSGQYNILIVPEKYYEVTSMDSMLRLLLSLSPLFIGVAFFAAIGMSLVRENKL